MVIIKSVQKQNCLIMFFITVMKANTCFGRTRRDSVKKLTRLFVPVLIDQSRE
jgi:hypothetical protein